MIIKKLTQLKSKLNKNRKGGIFDEAWLLAVKGLILIIIISQFVISILSNLDKLTSYIDSLTDSTP